MHYILETERLRLRTWRIDDIDHLKQFLQDMEVMYAYEHAFSDEEVQRWLQWNMKSYQENGYGLWAIERCNTGEVIGECGLTNQTVEGKSYLEIGYHLVKKHWHKGYGIEAAKACKHYAFEKLNKEEVVSIVRDTNISSMNLAIRNGMVIKTRFMKHYHELDMPHYLFSVKKR
ncbi:GNAT family N-acetyltransferase [Sporolactobacillus terrae]|uniref:Acetyltransferase n=1 Tax=Sporolactobacillus terrae TaxID=269673 RepID=A0A410DBC2_9BACL|nr:GNAT family N-acetyltransferase [Sporolactobacillus terrae]QAA23373.1 N-acetyltransferase [Sporolactobacillus terrae]QAA26344.1 N-acetyltransferase [Sporolactobacillus terrae]UAK15435.1 GNAT family N-acetyltransferase [Sporolactobacillus terrae]BBN99790.1 acetyltransferase [Sporolactobacillus terrae]